MDFQFQMKVMFIYNYQKDKRWMTGKADYRSMAIGFCVCELTGSHLRLHEFWDGKCQNMPVYGQLRQVAERIVLAPGNYVVICSIQCKSIW